MARHQHRNIMSNIQKNMSLRKPSYAFTAGPEKLKQARDLVQRKLFGGKGEE